MTEREAIIEAMARAMCEFARRNQEIQCDGPSVYLSCPCWPVSAAAIDAALPMLVGLVERERDKFLSPQYAANQPLGSFCERFACDEVANALRSLQEPSK